MRKLAAPLVLHGIIAVIAAIGSVYPAGDFDRYWAIASDVRRPYRDFQVEHPVGTLLVFRATATVAPSRPAFGVALVCLNVVAESGLVAALVWGWGVGAALAFCWAVLPVLHLLLTRIDFWSMACATLAAAAWIKRHPRTTGLALATGVAFKLWPAMFAPLLVLSPGGGRPRMAGAAACLTAGGLMLGVWWWIAGWAGLYQVLTFRGAQGWQVESSVGNILSLVTALPLRQEAGATRLGVLSGEVSIALFLVATPLALLAVWRGAATNRLAEGWLAGVGALLLLSALFSAQYIGWLLPGAAIAWHGGRRRTAGLAFAAVALTGLFWGVYGFVLARATPALALILVRNVIVAAMVVAAARGLVQPFDRRVSQAMVG